MSVIASLNIAQLEASLWEAADQLRANSKLSSSEYCMPALGVIFLRHATNRHQEAATTIEADQAAGKMPKRPLVRGDSYKRRALMLPIYGSTGVVGHHHQAKVAAPGVVTGRSGTLGVVHFVSGDYWPLHTALWVKEFKRVTPLFALFLLRAMDLKQYNGGASVPTLDRKSAHRVGILIPSRQLLRSFEDFVSDVFKQIKNLEIQNQKLRAARDLLLPRLMSGDLIA